MTPRLALNLFIGLGLLLILVLLVTKVLSYGQTRYDAGFATADNACTIRSAEHLLEALDEAEDLRDELDELRTIHAAQIAEFQAQTPVHVETVTRYVRENPDFAVLARPDRLHEARQERLGRLQRRIDRAYSSQLPD